MTFLYIAWSEFSRSTYVMASNSVDKHSKVALPMHMLLLFLISLLATFRVFARLASTRLGSNRVWFGCEALFTMRTMFLPRSPNLIKHLINLSVLLIGATTHSDLSVCVCVLCSDRLFSWEREWVLNIIGNSPRGCLVCWVSCRCSHLEQAWICFCFDDERAAESRPSLWVWGEMEGDCVCGWAGVHTRLLMGSAARVAPNSWQLFALYARLLMPFVRAVVS